MKTHFKALKTPFGKTRHQRKIRTYEQSSAVVLNCLNQAVKEVKSLFDDYVVFLKSL
jgi:hypothetical protein